MLHTKRRELKEKYKGEEVLAVEKNKKINFQVDVLEQLNESADYYPRYKMEFNKHFMQIIPYVVIFSPDKESVFVTKRLEGSGEELLVGKLSIGIGGHINPIDKRKSIINTIEDALHRELNEEVSIKGDYELVCTDTIYTDQNLVSSCHLGLVYHLYPTSDEFIVKVKEKDVLEGEMVEVKKLLEASEKDLQDNGHVYEEWMKVVLQRLKESKENVNE